MHSVRDFGQLFTETSWIVTISVLGAVAIAWAIVVGVISVSKIVVRHRERMAQIGMGITPQQSKEFPRKSAG